MRAPRVFVLAVIGYLLCGATADAAKHQRGGAAGTDRVTGSGAINVLEGLKAKLTLTATSAADATGPGGTAEAESLLAGVPVSFGGKVTCVRVRGHRAVVKYAFDHASPGVLRGGGIEVFIEDAGIGRNDTIGFLPPQDPVSWQLAGPSRCDPFDFRPFQVQSGDFTVTDS